MLGFRVLASTAPLLMLGLFAHSELIAGPQPCIAAGDQIVRIAPSAWMAQLHVGFTDDPARANVRVQIVDDPDAADFAVSDDSGSDEAGACAATPDSRLIAIAAHPSAAEPVIYLTRESGAADYRIYVRSSRFTEREAAALLVGASTRAMPISTAALGNGS
ncbi:hypothetical protein LPW26_17705 [Rhodopseudomonas sp. HC1]|uniref:hypothetical protein n=1 Tax=Rhodopseudomonas infernalis TaxID=2897386 RepID=UPI001EE9839C|nr:hypothetical protein [Rhodopseudomonas infernalis]MCG6206487.1 hypothetical protein [Rhodopseudomonas infernalis]